MAENEYTLLGVRSDGVAPVMDLVVAGSGRAAYDRARSFLAEHSSCTRVEVWLGGRLLREILREDGGKATAG